MLKKKTVLLLIPFGIVLFLFSLVLQAYPSMFIHASSTNYLVLNNKDKFAMPVNIFVCVYNVQEDSAYIEADHYYYPDGTANPSTKVWHPNHFKIESQNDITALKDRLKYYNIEYEQDVFMFHDEDDCLPSYFLIATTAINDYPYNSETTLGSTVSEIKALSKVKAVLLPNNNWEYNFSIQAIDNTSPVINGFEGAYITSVGAPASVETIKSQLTAVDDVDGNITSKIIVKSDNYSANKNKVGVYSIVFEVSDNSNNKASITINVSVIDNIKPAITGPSTITSNLSNPQTIDSIKAQMSASDNYDGNITNSIVVYADTFSPNSSKVGEYNITFKVTDSSNNYTTKNVTVSVVDDIKPLISGPSNYTKSTSTSLTSSSILSSLTATDNVDGDISSKITEKTNSYIGNESKVGTYTITYTVKDNANNTSDIFTVSIKVEDTEPPVFYISNNVINITIYNTLTHEDMINYLCSTKQIDTSKDYTYTFVSDEYQGNEDQEGVYNVLTKISYSDGEEKELKLSVRVNSNKGSSDIAIEDISISEDVIENTGFFARIFTWIKVKASIFTDFFAGLWDSIFGN